MSDLKSTSLFLFLCFIFAFETFAQKKLTYDQTNFKSIEISSALSAEITQSDVFKIEAECDEKACQYIHVFMEGNELNVETKNWNGSGSSEIKFYISLPALDKLEVTGASSVRLNGFKAENMEIEIAGASTLISELEVKNLEVEVSGASSMNTKGNIQNLNLEISGASGFDGMNSNITDSFILEGSGASHISAKSDGDMQVELSGASTLTYSGEGDILKQEVTGASNISKK